MPPLLRVVYAVATALLAAGLVVIVLNQLRAQQRVGRMRVESIPGVAGRWGGAALLVAAGVLAWFGRGEIPLTWSLPALALALCVQLFRPNEMLRVVGEDGVRVGWYARRLEELEEWRLTGDHLRFRLRGLWRAVDLPHSEHRDYRERLEARAGERESRFTD